MQIVKEIRAVINDLHVYDDEEITEVVFTVLLGSDIINPDLTKNSPEELVIAPKLMC